MAHPADLIALPYAGDVRLVYSLISWLLIAR